MTEETVDVSQIGQEEWTGDATSRLPLVHVLVLVTPVCGTRTEGTSFYVHRLFGPSLGPR